MIPSPMDYLKSHAIAFVAGAVAVIAVQGYAGLRTWYAAQSELFDKQQDI